MYTLFYALNIPVGGLYNPYIGVQVFKLLTSVGANCHYYQTGTNFGTYTHYFRLGVAQQLHKYKAYDEALMGTEVITNKPIAALSCLIKQRSSNRNNIRSAIYRFSIHTQLVA